MDEKNVGIQEPEIVRRAIAAKDDMLAADALIQDYLPFIRAEASKATKRIITENDDEMSIGMIAFHEAIQSYSKLKGAFIRYASVVIRRRLIDYHRTQIRHYNTLSLDRPLLEEDGETFKDTIVDESVNIEEMDLLSATKEEIVVLTLELESFGITMSDIAENCPKQERTLQVCQDVLCYAKENDEIIETIKRTKRLAIAPLVEGTGVSRKTVERHRKYILALLVIYSNGYEMIRGHLQLVLPQKKGVVLS